MLCQPWRSRERDAPLTYSTRGRKKSQARTKTRRQSHTFERTWRATSPEIGRSGRTGGRAQEWTARRSRVASSARWKRKPDRTLTNKEATELADRGFDSGFPSI